MTIVGKMSVATPSDREIVITRDFDAPRPLVFDCWTKPALLKRWLFGPDGWSLATCDIDLRVGGAYRFVWHGPGGIVMGMGGVYREVVPPERLANTQLFDQDWTGGEVLGTLVLTERAGRTTTVNTLLYPSRLARDGALQTGMLQGMEMGHARVDAILAATAAG
jgi:uncharacterized protein YndB with AHSA1/START domain